MKIPKSVTLLLILALGLRFAALGFESLWLDEAYQTGFDAFGVALPNFMHFRGAPLLFKFSDVQTLTTMLGNFRAVDPLCPPLYPVLLNRWLTVFGGDDIGLRSMSVVISTLSVVALYVTCRPLFGTRVALLSALVEALSPYDIAYGQEARMYSMVTLFAIVSFASFFKIVSTSSFQTNSLRNLVAIYAIATWALINSHYTALFALASQMILGAVLCAKRRDARLFGWLMVAWSLVSLLWLPWFDLFLQAAQTSRGAFYVDRVGSIWWAVQALLVRMPINWITFLAGKRVTLLAFPLYAISVFILCFGAYKFYSSWQNWMGAGRQRLAEKGAPGQQYLIPYAAIYWCVVPSLLLWLADCIGTRKVIEISRYLIFTAPAVYLLAGNGLASLSANRKLLVGVGTYSLFCLVNLTYLHLVWQQCPWREIAVRVEQLTKGQDIVMVSQYLDIICLDRYLDRPVRQVSLSPNLGKEKIAYLFSDSFPGLKQFWLVSSGTGDLVVPMLPADFKVTQQIDFPHSLHLRHFEAP